ncbi:hypothetical protein FJT64_019194 [Amphibalanus amphitrite]|uniref:Transposable element P transposase-like GTP-binding insertion domain-containing protein n=1 Tax=Amphibalanus amphitrite TaxID=1232801 RepID=A0A6A4WSI8_AMPAM|nr:hypothetical protein FJT64_019194 [Amphibalanus amphitrite]
MESLAIYYQGEKAYKHLQKTFVLPSVRCLQKRIEMIQFKPGFQDWILSVMQEKFREAPEHEKLVVLSFDEMQELYSKLGVSAAAPTFELDGVEVVCIHDVPHLIKCLRNTLMKHDILVDDKRASWSHVTEFFEKDSQRTLRSAPKLTRKHVAPNNFQKMKVRYAAQVLSRSVAVGISLYSACG